MKEDDPNQPLEPNLETWIEPELEARIVALVLGEASDFEREGLERLIAEKPELALFRDRIASTHELLGEVVSGKGDAAEWKLSAERRKSVLDVVSAAPTKKKRDAPVATSNKKTGKPWVRWMSLSAAACLIGFSTLNFFLPVGHQVTKQARTSEIASLSDQQRKSEESALYSYADSVKPRMIEFDRAEMPTTDGDISIQPSSTSTRTSGEQAKSLSDTNAVEAAPIIVAKNTVPARSSLSAISETLTENVVTDEANAYSITGHGDFHFKQPSNSGFREDAESVERNFTMIGHGGVASVSPESETEKSEPGTLSISSSGAVTIGGTISANGSAGAGGSINIGGGVDLKTPHAGDIVVPSQQKQSGKKPDQSRSAPQQELGRYPAHPAPSSKPKPAAQKMSELEVADESGESLHIASSTTDSDMDDVLHGGVSISVDFGETEIGKVTDGIEPLEDQNMLGTELSLHDSPVDDPFASSGRDDPFADIGHGDGSLRSRPMPPTPPATPRPVAKPRSNSSSLAQTGEEAPLEESSKMPVPTTASAMPADAFGGGLGGGGGMAIGDDPFDDRPVIPDEVAEMEESDDEFALVPPQPQEPQQSFFKRKFSGGAEDLRGFETKNVGPQRELKPGHGQVTPLRIEVEELPEMEKSVDESGEATLPPRGGTTGLHVQNRGSIRTSGTASSGGIIVLEEAQEEEVATEPQKKANMAAIKIDIEGNDRTKDSVLPNEKAIDSGITKTVADRSKASGAREINGIAAVVENQVITRSELKEKALSLAEKERQQTGRKLTRTEEEELEKRALSEITEEILDREPQGANGSKFRSYANLGADIPFEMTRTYQAAPKPQQVTFPEESTAKNPFSTFSLHVSDVSFKLALEALAKGKWPAKERIRVEEFVNAIDYGDPMPSQAEKVAASQEQAIHPFLQQRNLLRIAMRTAAAGRAGQTPLRLTILLDKSGSMERPDRVATVERAFTQLVGQLFPTDQVTLLSFARQPRLLADQTREAELSKLATLAAQTPTEGGTNLEAALLLAFEKAEEQKLIGAQNRIVLITDGAANLGDADPERLSRLIETIRDRGIAFDAAGVGAEGLNDEILEALTRKGDGRYYLLNGPEDADDGFAKQIAGALRPAAKNVKIQVEFNPERVGRYKLIGFEKHRLKKEDFRNDKVDAAEMAAEEAGVALYQIEPLAEGSGDIGSVSIRFRDMASGEMVERRWPIPYEPTAPRLDQAAPSMKLATCAALLGSKLKDDELGQTVDLGQLARYAASLQGERAGQLRQMIQQARDLTNE